MRHHLASVFPRILAAAVIGLSVALALGVGLLGQQPVAAQTPTGRIVGYGQTIPGEVTSPNGAEHFFTGCAGEVVGLSVTANDFSPRIDLYGAEADVPLDSATTGAASRSVVLAGVTLPASGVYSILVTGRGRGDRGGYSVTLQGTSADGVPLDDAPSLLTLLHGDVVTGSVPSGGAEQWNFRGCEGDEILAQLDTGGFVPDLLLFFPFAASPLATAEIEDQGDDGVTAILGRLLPDTGYYSLTVAAANRTDAGDYSLSFTLEGNAAPAPATPTPAPTRIVPTPSANPTATPTSSGGPRVRRGIPTPKATVSPTFTPTAAQGPTATFTPTPTPEFLMPGLGEGAFRVLDVGSAGGPVNHVTYSPDGTLIATAGEDGAVRVWDAFSGELLQTMEGHEERVNYLAFSPDDTWLASAGDDGSVRLWNQAGQEVTALEMPDAGVNSVAFSPDSTELVATTGAGDVLVWDVADQADQAVRLTLAGHEGPVYHATFSADGTLIATGDSAGVVRIWNRDDGALVDTLPVNVGPGSGDPILSVAFSDDGSAIVVGGVIGVNAASVHIVDLQTGDPIGALVGHGEWGSTAVVSPDDGYIFSAGRAEPSHDGPTTATARLWSTETGELAIAFVGYPSSVIAATFRPDGDEIMSSDGLYVYIWPSPMIDVFAATFGEPVGVQIPTPEETATTPTATPRATPTRAATRAPTATPLPTPTLRPTFTPTPAVTVTPTPFIPSVNLEIFCTVITDRLNLRPGPGTNFNPPLDVLETGELLVVVGRTADSTWLQVAVLDENLNVANTGWVSADFVFCVGEIDDAPVVEVDSA